MKKAKYEIGQFVYSYLNKTEKRPINRIRKPSDETDVHAYRLTLAGRDGSPQNSKWINEDSLSLRKFK